MVNLRANAVRRRTLLLTGVAILLGAAIREGRCAANPSPSPTISPLQSELIEKLYAPVERQADFDKAAARAGAEKVPEQTILEARLAFCIRTRRLDERLPATIEQLAALCAGLRWKKEDSRLFNTPAEATGALHFARALLAARAGNTAEYEREVKEAFWNNPNMGALLAEELRTHRRDGLASVPVPMEKAFVDADGRSATLSELVKDKRAILLEFWASWCEPCMARMEDLKKRGDGLIRHRVQAAGVSIGDDRGTAAKVRADTKIKFPWLVESAAERPLSRALGVDTIPQAVLIGADGRVRFRGHPDDPALDAALEAMSVHWRED